MAKSIPLVWTIHCRTAEDKTNFENTLRSSRTALDRLRDILEYKLEELEKEELSDKFFEDPNLDPRFFRNQGRKKELRQLLDLLTF